MNHEPPTTMDAAPPLLRGERLKVVACGGVGLLCLAMLHAFDPAVHSVYLVCPLHRLTGLHCAGCGGQRAIHELLHGHLVAALSQNLIAVLVCVPLTGYLYAAWALRVFRGVNLPIPRPTPLRVVIAVSVCLAYAILRNLPAFAWLAPA